MNGDIAEEPFAKAVLQHLAKTRGKNDPLGSFARTVVSGEASLRTAANFSWHSDALAAAADASQREQHDMTPEERAAIEREGERLRDTPIDDDQQRDGHR